MSAVDRVLRNLEGHETYDVRWPWAGSDPQRPGATAVLRCKDEAANLPFVLPPLLRACDRVLVVDNGSSDGTADVAAEVAARAGAADRLDLAAYPFDVARAGAEHLATPERSVHSLAYFYNWCFAQVRTRWSWKWDGDMVLTREGEVSLAALSWQVGRADLVVRVPRHGLWVRDERTAWLDLGMRNAEEWGFPVAPAYTYAKAFEWEIRTTPERVRTVVLPEGMSVELKRLDGREFAHWTDPAAFAANPRQARKQREWELFRALVDRADGDPLPDGVVEVVAPAGVHVVDHVVRDWLPRAPRPLPTDVGRSGVRWG